MSAKRAVELGMAERVLQAAPEELGNEVVRLALQLAASPKWSAFVRKEKALHTPAHVAQLGLPR